MLSQYPEDSNTPVRLVKKAHIELADFCTRVNNTGAWRQRNALVLRGDDVRVLIIKVVLAIVLIIVHSDRADVDSAVSSALFLLVFLRNAKLLV